MNFSKTIVPLAFSLISLTGLAQDHVGGGGDFHYMRSLEALKQNELKAILGNEGRDFMKSVISPIAWKGMQDVYRPVTKNDLRKFWQEFGKSGLSGMWTKIETTKLEDCSCAGITERESDDNQICAIQDKETGDNKICLDVKKIIDPQEKINLDYHTLAGAIWHELGHLYVPETPHAVLYELGNKIKNSSIRDELMVSKISQTDETTGTACKINAVVTEAKNLYDCANQAFEASASEKVIMRYRDLRGVFAAQAGVKSKKLTCGLGLSTVTFNKLSEEIFYNAYFGRMANNLVRFDKKTELLTYDVRIAFNVNTPETCLNAFSHGFDADGGQEEGFGKMKLQDDKGNNVITIRTDFLRSFK